MVLSVSLLSLYWIAQRGAGRAGSGMQALQTDVNQRHWTSWLVASIRGHLGTPLNTKQSRSSIKKIQNGKCNKIKHLSVLTELVCIYMFTESGGGFIDLINNLNHVIWMSMHSQV